MTITIVPMATCHVPYVAGLEKECFSDPWPENILAAELQNPLSLWLAAEAEGKTVGYIGSQIVPDEADMMNLCVAPAYRRCGIADRLIDALELELRSRHVVSLTLEVRAGNAPAIALYQKHDFLQVGRRKNYYYHPKEDALILRKEWTL